MATVTVLLKLERQHLAPFLQEAGEKLNSAEGEMVLDFSGLTHIYPCAILALEELAQRAEERAVKVVLQGVNVHVYKVLKLVRLAPKFSFANANAQRANG